MVCLQKEIKEVVHDKKDHVRRSIRWSDRS
jgi:hypothetical protein